MCGVSEISPTALKRVAAGLSQCERSCQSKLGTGGANRHCDCDGYRPDILGGGFNHKDVSSIQVILLTCLEAEF